MSRRKKAPKKSHIGVVQDKSGSMSTRYVETISGYNQFIDTLREEAESDTYVTLVQFDTTKVSVYEQKPLDSVPALTDKTYVLGGMTALRDGVGEAISRMEKFVRPGDNVAITVMTDGGENASVEVSDEAIKALIRKKESDGWEFNFLGAGPEAWGGADILGIDNAHSIFYGSSAHDHQRAFAGLAASNVAKTGGRSSSYATTASALKSDLEDTAGAVPPVQINIGDIRPAGKPLARRRGSGKNLK